MMCCGGDKMATSAVRDMIVREAREWNGTPYIGHAQVKRAGCDCASFLAGVYCAAGLLDFGPGRILVDVIGHYPLDWNVHGAEERYLKWLEQWCDKVSVPEPGDIAMFVIGGKLVSHSAICLEVPNTPRLYLSLWIHCMQPCVREFRWNDKMANRLHGFYRMKGLV